MENRIQPGSFFQYSPTGVHDSLHRSSSISDRERYVGELLAERHKLGPFMQILPICSRLLNQEIIRASGLVSAQSSVVHEKMGLEHTYRTRSFQQPNGGPMDVETWPAMQTEV
ncbi:unnamed protein product [Ilex paraguariensis]|uniref:STAR protein homodimerisation region domain-containing protein n=1 Tax=Ilex paraguariensis TaxID=185542 RepID=A0ABC8RXA9_9AQUA